MNGLVPGSKACQRFGFIAPPHAGGDNARCAAPGADGIAEMVYPIGAVGKYLAGIVGQCCGAGLAIVDVSGRDGDLFYKRRVGIGANMALKP